MASTQHFPAPSPPAEPLTPEEFTRHRKDLEALLRRYRLTFNDEAMLQGQIETILKNEGLVYIREARLSEKDRPDFLLVDNGIAVEVKVRGSVDVHLRQLRRYADYPDVRGVILICIKPAEMPGTLAGKPVGLIHLYQGLF